MRINPVYSCLILFTLLVACQGERRQLDAEIERLEKTVEASPSPEQARRLIELYQEYAAKFTGDHQTNAKYLYRAAGLAYRMNRFTDAIDMLTLAIKDHYAGDNTPNNALLLGAIYEDKLRNETLYATVYQAAAQAFPGVAAIKEKNRDDWPPLEDRLAVLGRAMFDPEKLQTDYRAANDFINACTIHAMLLPNSERSAQWLFDAASTARSIRAFSKAMEFYEWILERFPNSQRASQALFLQAFTLDNDLKRHEEAGAAYREFLRRFPNNEFADDAQILLNNLGKDDAEIIRAFEQGEPEQ
jgi:TolA-binding protein